MRPTTATRPRIVIDISLMDRRRELPRCPVSRLAGSRLLSGADCQMHGDPTYLNAAPIRATSVKRAYGPGPVTTRAAGLGCLFFWILPRSCPGLLAARPGSGWSARSRAAAAQRRGRTSLTPASGGRSPGAGKGVGCGLAYAGSRAGSGAWRAEWSRKHPSGAAPACGAAAMTMCPGTGLLSQMIERGAGAGSCRRASVPGA